jgi:hypothetical protein
MAHNLFLLQQQLDHLEASYRPPSQLDFVSGATVDHRRSFLSYLLAHLLSEADHLVLSSAYVDFQTGPFSGRS